MYERVYYPLTTAAAFHATAASDSDREVKTGIVVDIDRTAGTPVVTLRSPLQVKHIHTYYVCIHTL